MMEKYCSETEAAGIMELSVEDFRQRLASDQRSPKGFGMPGTDEPHFVRALIFNYKNRRL